MMKTNKKYLTFTVFLYLFLFSFHPILTAQDDTPCECAQRWTGGAAWNPDGSINDSNSAGPPNGIIKCANAASTQSNINTEACVYNSSQFEIDLSVFPPCLSPNTGLPVTLNGPGEGCDIIWLNFDVRPNAGSYDYQIIGNDIGWALYNVDDVVATTGVDPVTSLSGDCNVLEPLACGDAFGNSFATFDVPDFPNATNLYLAMWSEVTCVPNPTFSVNFKARFGCGDPDVCILETPESATTECSATGSTYTVTVPISGINGTYVAIDNNSSLPVSPAVVLTSEADASPVTSGFIVATYPSGTNYDFTITETAEIVGNFGDCTATFSGIAPNCCSLEVDCSGLTDMSFECASEIPAPNNSLVSVTNSCSTPSISSSDVTFGGNGCPGSSTIITRTYTVIDGGDSEDCVQVFTLTTPIPTINCPAATTVECLANVVSGVATAADGCGAAITVTPTAPILLSGIAECDGAVYQITYNASDICGRTASCTQNITLSNAAPTITCPAPQTVECLADITAGTAVLTTSCGLSDNGVTTSAPVLFSGQAECDGAIYQITYSATDECERDASCTQNFTLSNTPPLVSCPAATTVECLADVVAGTATVETSCGLSDNGIMTSSAILLSGQAACDGAIYQITYSVTDECNRSDDCTQNITLSNAAPTITCPAPSIVICLEDVTAGVATFTTSCGLTNQGIVTGEPLLTSGQEGCDAATYQIQHSFTDECGRTASCQQIFTLSNDAPIITCPAPQMVECIADVTVGMPTTMAGCMITLDMVTTTGPTLVSGQAECDGAVYTMLYSVTDGCERTSTCNQAINLSNAGPVITCPAATTVECLANVVPGTATATSSCGLTNDPITTSAAVLISGQAECNGAVYQITYSVTDECGRSDDCTQNITLSNAAPTITCPAPQTVECLADITAGIASSTSSCGLTNSEIVISSPILSTGTAGCNNALYQLTYSVADECGRSASCIQSFTLSNEAPTIICPISQTVNCFSDIVSGTPIFTSECDLITNDFTVSPPILTSGVAECNAAVYTFTYSITDICSRTSSCTQDFTLDVNGPEITCPTAQTVSCAADIAPQTPIFTTDCNLGTEPFLNTAPFLISGQANCDGAIYGITYSVTDICGLSASCTQEFILNPPAVVINFVDEVEVECVEDINPEPSDLDFTVACGLGGHVVVSPGLVTGDINCSGTEVKYDYDLTTDCGEILNFTKTYRIVNTGIIITSNCDTVYTVSCFNNIPDPTLADIEFTTACGNEVSLETNGYFSDNDNCSGLYLVDYSLTDDCGNEASCTISWQIDPQTPIFEQIDDLFLDLTQTSRDELIADWLSTMQANAVCGNTISAVTHTYDVSQFTSWGCGDQTETQEVIFSVTSECGEVSTMTASIYLDDMQPPSCSAQADLTIACDELDFETTLNDWVTYNGTITDYSHPIAFSSDFPDDFEYSDARDGMEVTWTAIDRCDNASTFSAVLTIIDNTAPIITTEAQNLDLVASQTTIAEIQEWLATQAGAVAVDNCSDAIQWTISPENPLDGIDANFPGAMVTFTATDDFGNSVSTTANITISGSLPLQFLEFPANRTVSCAEGAGIAEMPLVVYNCEAPTSELSETFIEGECCNESVLYRNWVFTDNCGYQCERQQTITFYDNIAPIFTFSHPELLDVMAGDTVSLMASELSIEGVGLIAVDDVSDICITTQSVSIVDTLNCISGEYFHLLKVDWTATDACNNAAKFEIYVRYIDDIPPVFTFVPEDQTIGCNEIPYFPTPTAEDNHEIMSFSHYDVVTGNPCPGTTIITRFWSIVDACGNSQSASASIKIVANGEIESTYRSNSSKEKESLSSDLVFLPTAAKNEVQLNFKSLNIGNAQLKIFDIYGKQVFEKDLILQRDKNQYSINISNLVSGTYYAVLSDGSNKRTGRFIKIR